MKKFAGILSILLCFQTGVSCADELLDKGLWWLYHLQYDKARESFDQYIKIHPDDPAGYFYQTATSWWHLAQDVEFNRPEIQEKLEEDSQRTITVARDLYNHSKDDKERARACLYWGGAEGLWGRWLVTRKEWVSAYFAGKRGRKMLKRALELDPKLFDAYLGLGIYDYYTDTLSGVQAVLAAMLIHGDRKRGLEELHIALDKSEHARVEAKCFLIEIYTSEENNGEKALPLARSLHTEFPQSPAMHLIEVSTLFRMKKWDEMQTQAEDFLAKADKEQPWYNKFYIPPARYCIGVAKLWGKHDLEGAMAEMEKIIAEDKEPSRWISFAHLRRGQIQDLRGNRSQALEDYHATLKGPDLWGTHAEARQYIKKQFKF